MDFFKYSLNIDLNQIPQYFYKSVLFKAVESGNLELVKYLVSLGKFDLTEVDVFYFFMEFQIHFNSRRN